MKKDEETSLWDDVRRVHPCRGAGGRISKRKCVVTKKRGKGLREKWGGMPKRY